MEITEFWTILSANNIILEPQQLRAIKRYNDELKYWNEKINMISRKDVDNLLEKHILHSISVLKFVEFPKNSLCLDVGTGGGLPGIPLKIVRPDLKMILVDSIAKKVKITQMLAKHTGLRGIEVIHSRAEDLIIAEKYKSTFDFVLSRAVAKISTVLAWVKPLLKPNGKVVFYKGGNLTNEINEVKKIFSNLEHQISLIRLVGYKKFEEEDKKIVVCEF
ncbi:MAG: 16S rRNA (guanine(527)-N(7))-methyltransferase RsmG [Candidatus Kapaibacteriales bacterium]